MGLWWADAAAALVVAGSILRDGVKNLRGCIRDLTDGRARSYDGTRPHPVVNEIDQSLRGLAWVRGAASRVRDEGHVFHVESFVVPRHRAAVSLDQLEDARARCLRLDWKIHDIVLIPVAELPAELDGQSSRQQSDGEP